MSKAAVYLLQTSSATPLQRAQEVVQILANAILRCNKQLVFQASKSVHVPKPQRGKS